MTRQKILIPIGFPDPEYIPKSLIRAISGMDVVLLGWFDREEGASLEVTDQYEREMRAKLYEHAAELLRSGSEVTIDLFFDEEGETIRDRIADEEHVDAIYVPRPITSFGRLLVPLRDERTGNELVDFVAELDEDALVHLTLYHVADDPDDVPEAEEMLRNIKRRITAEGMPVPSTDIAVDVNTDPAFQIGAKARDYDAIVIGETAEESLKERVFGTIYERISEEVNQPVIVVRRGKD